MFDLFNVLFPIMFLLIIIMIIVNFAKGITTWSKNNHSPRLTVFAKVVAKRQDTIYNQQGVAGDPTGAHGFHTTSHTTYYVTFQVESGDRMEFVVSGTEYGVLVEEDQGQLSFQGTRYLSFDREYQM